MQDSVDTAYISKIRLKNSLLIPVFFLFIIWFIKLIEIFFEYDFGNWGILPRRIGGLKGIFTAPLIHGSLSHLMANSIPIFLLSWGIFYFYRTIAFKIFFLCYFLTGILLWALSYRYGYHIGISGLIYAFAFFLFLSGILRKYNRLIAISLIVVFLYGSLIWGIFPLDEEISYEGHFAGAIVGLVLAIVYRKQGPQAPVKIWDEEEEDDDDMENNIDNDENKTNEFDI